MSSPRAATSVATSRSALPVAEPLHHAVALLLRHAAVQRLGAVAARVQRSASSSTSVRVRQKTSADVGFSMSSTRPSAAGLLRARDDVRDLAHLRRLAGALRLARSIVTRAGSRRCRSAIAAMRGGSVAENSAVCRVFGRRLEDRLEVLGEAHVEHLVRLVEDDQLHATSRLERAPADVIERAARRRDDDVDAALERADLLLHRLRRRRPAAR